MLNSLWIGAGGFVGANLRYWLGAAIAGRGGLPATFFINIAGALLIGLISGWAARYDLNPQILLFLKVGLCGGFTTFSTFALESTQMLQNGQWIMAGCYMILSVILCVAAVFLGESLVK